MHKTLFALAISAWFYLFVSAIAQTFTTESIPRQIPNSYGAINELSALQIFDGEGDILEVSRGIILQGVAGFSDPSGSPIEPTLVSIRKVRPWYFWGVEAYCIQLAGSDCTNLHLPPDQIERLLAFVKNERLIAFSLPGNARQGRRSSVERKLSGFGLVPTDYDGTGKWDDWIALELDNEYFARVFRLIDFDPPPFVSNRSAATANEIRKGMNTELGHESKPSGPIQDDTWLNTDLHALFVGQIVNEHFQCQGLPARYTWELMRGQTKAYISKVQFAREPTSRSSRLYQAHQTFCTVSVLRRLWKDNAKGVSEIREFDG